MTRKFTIACLLCTVLLECVAARPSGCQDIQPRYNLERLIRRGAAIASSLRNLRSVRERRWGGSYPVWKTLHRTMQHRAMDITKLPSIPPVDPGPNAAVAKDLNIGVEDFWHDEPFKFPGLVVKPPESHRPAEEPEAGLGWGPFGEDTADPRWGVYREPIDNCNDDVAGSLCTSHSECQGCRDFHCSVNTNRCEPGPELDPIFEGFY